MSKTTFFANEKQQVLSEHLFAIGVVAHAICYKLTGNSNIARAAYFSGGLHDIGKVSVSFQGQWASKKVKKTNFQKHPRHNEISSLLTQVGLDKSQMLPLNISFELLKAIKHAIHWHHPKPLRKEEFKSFGCTANKLHPEDSLNDLLVNANEVLTQVNQFADKYNFPEKLPAMSNHIDTEKLDVALPFFKEYRYQFNELNKVQEATKLNAVYDIVRASLITADQIISSLDADQLTSAINSKSLEKLALSALEKKTDLEIQIGNFLTRFDKEHPNNKQSFEQNKAAQVLTNMGKISALFGAAGCGKTKIALEWAKNKKTNQLFWVVPRVQIGQSIFSELCSNKYLPNSKIELLTGDFKLTCENGAVVNTEIDKQMEGDIVITTIDQMVNGATSHSCLSSLVKYLNSDVVFDEYHEYATMSSFNLLFAELIECKRLIEDRAGSTLLVSATPNFTYLKEVLGLDTEYDVLKVNSFNESKYLINVIEYDEDEDSPSNPFYSVAKPNSIVVSNTATVAQKSYIKNQESEDSLLFHSKYTRSDKESIFKAIVENFGNGFNSNTKSLRAGPIIQASLNITCAELTTEFTTPENFCQRVGRLDRFGENTGTNIINLAIEKSITNNSKNSVSARFLSSVHSFNSAISWYEFVTEYIEGSFQISDLYNAYEAYYQDELNQKKVAEDLLKSINSSISAIQNAELDPVWTPISPRQKNKLKRNSLRCHSRYAQMAVCRALPSGVELTNEYLFDDSEESTFTFPIRDMAGGGNQRKSLIQYMFQKHHRVMQGKGISVKKEWSIGVLANKATEPDSPIFLSYTESDLAEINETSHKSAIYYAVGKSQPIGAIAIDKLS